MDVIWSTKSIPPARRAKEWTAALSRQIFPVQAEVGEPRGFRGEFRMCGFGPTAFLRIRSRRQTIRRSEADITARDADWLFVSTMTRGTGYLHHAGGVARVPRGAVSFVDGDQPFALEFRRDFAYVSALVMRRDIVALLPAADRAHGTVIPAPAGPALSAFLTALEPCAGAPSIVDENRLYDHFLGLASAALAPFVSMDAPSGSPPGMDLLARVRAYLIAHLDAEAPILMAVNRFGITPRKLQRMFRAEGTTPTLWLRGQRLERCARDLCDPRQAGRSITAIATARGFDDTAYFSRCFRAAFGVSPASYRREGQQGQPDPVADV